MSSSFPMFLLGILTLGSSLAAVPEAFAFGRQVANPQVFFNASSVFPLNRQLEVSAASLESAPLECSLIVRAAVIQSSETESRRSILLPNVYMLVQGKTQTTAPIQIGEAELNSQGIPGLTYVRADIVGFTCYEYSPQQPLKIAVGSFYRPDTGPAPAEDFHHSCDILRNGRVQCWGDNKEGQLGIPLDTTRATQPVTVFKFPGEARQIYAGYHSTCAVDALGSTYCWGHLNRALGAPIDVPTKVEGLAEKPLTIAIGLSQACALVGSGRVQCWGNNAFGQLGDGTRLEHNSAVDVQIPTEQTVVALTAGNSRSCAATQDGSIFCWGMEAEPFGGFMPSAVSVPVPAALYSVPEPIQQISMGDYQPWGVNYCALTTGKQVYCWGQNFYSEVSTKHFAIRTPQLIAPLFGKFTSIAMGLGTLFGLTTEGRLLAVSAGSTFVSAGGRSGTFADPVQIANNVAEFAVGWGHVCVLTTSAEYRCVGQNDVGQLGNGTLVDTVDPKFVQ